uniref:Uncharacterized protein n=1 Tax=Graphocephala atropunctata TaxID=36148 RepID=A0A1B6KFH6_9HEMI
MANELSGSEDFYRSSNKTMTTNLAKLNEILDNILTMRSQCGKIRFELNHLYSPKFLQSLMTLENKEEDDNIKKYIDMIPELRDIPCFQSEAISRIQNSE